VLRNTEGVVENGKLVRLWGAARDITENRQSEELLHQSEQRYRAFVANSSEGIFRVEFPEPIPIDLPPEEIVRRNWETGVMAECNQAMATMREASSPEQLIGRHAMQFRLNTKEEFQQALDFVNSGFRFSGVERPALTITGERKWFRYSALGVVEDGALARIWGTVSDVTDRKRLEAELRSLSARSTTVLEQERARVAREIHDELGQQLTVLKFEAAAWEQGKRAPVKGGLTTEIDRIIQTVRRIASELRPIILDQYGLAAAFEWQAREFSRRTGIACQCHAEGDLNIAGPIATTAFRILQEALTNAARHSGAESVRIELSRLADRLDLEIRDNGRGFNPTQPRADVSLGLAGMRERAASSGGTLIVSSVAGGGTLVSASFPIPPESTEASK
jgi:signal transduction histidine kinase